MLDLDCGAKSAVEGAFNAFSIKTLCTAHAVNALFSVASGDFIFESLDGPDKYPMNPKIIKAKNIFAGHVNPNFFLQ